MEKQKSQDKSSAEWVVHKGKKIRSRMRKVTKSVTSKLDSSPNAQRKKGIDDAYEPPSLELIREKESSLHEAMTLNEQLARVVKSRRELQKQIKALNHKLETTNAWIVGIRENPKFLSVEEIGKLYDDIKTLKNYMKAAEDGSATMNGRSFGPPSRSTSLASFSDFSESEVLCSVCQKVKDAHQALWCHKCGYYVCGKCINAAKQCPKCLEGSIDHYSLGDVNGGQDNTSIDSGSISGLSLRDLREEMAREGEEDKYFGAAKAAATTTAEEEADYLDVVLEEEGGEDKGDGGGGEDSYHEGVQENIYEVIN